MRTTLLLAYAASGSGFALLAPSAPSLTSPSTESLPRTTTCGKGNEIELPDFDTLFQKIQDVSPLGRAILQGRGERGFDDMDQKGKSKRVPTGFSHHPDQQWKSVDTGARKAVQVEKIDNYDDHPAPLLRFRSSLQGPCISECFANFIMDLDTRKRWDTQIDFVDEIISIPNLQETQLLLGPDRGDCVRLGIGHCRTKAGFGISPREQLTMCGIQEFPNGSVLIWGKEMAEQHNHLFPPGQRHTRAQSHLFSITMAPKAEGFDVEYVLQLEIGGKIPTWLTTPVVVDSVKNMFKVTRKVFADTSVDSEISTYLRSKRITERHGVLMTP